MLLQFNDVLIEPKFSLIRSRAEVSLKQKFLGLELTTPIISSNMDTVTEEKMASTIGLYGGVGALHRFNDIERNVDMYETAVSMMTNTNTQNQSETLNFPIVSVGVGLEEFKRAITLAEVGAKRFLIDVAHGASIQTVEMYDKLRNHLPDNSYIIVGNFATAESVKEFLKYAKSKRKPDAIKIGIGGGSACTTRVVTGCGSPTLASIIDCAKLGISVIADGGHKNSGDIAKALAAGATVVMLGNLLSATEETPAQSFIENGKVCKEYRGSASLRSYEAQKKTAKHRTPEGEHMVHELKGSVVQVLDELNAGLLSSLSYVGAFNLTDFRKNAKLVQVSTHGSNENKAHGKV